MQTITSPNHFQWKNSCRLRNLPRTYNDHSPKDFNFTIGDFIFDTKLQLLKSENHNHKLTTKESDLLKLLCKNENAIWKETMP